MLKTFKYKFMPNEIQKKILQHLKLCCIQGKVKTLTIKREGNNWYTCFSQQMAKDTWKSLKKAISQVAWQSFTNKLLYKVEEVGRKVIKVNLKSTSSTCVQCGTRKKKALEERIHICPCGYQKDRDVMAAKNILRFGLSLINKKGRSPRCLVEGKIT